MKGVEKTTGHAMVHVSQAMVHVSHLNFKG